MSDQGEVRPIDANALCAILEAKAYMALVPEYKHAFLNVQAMVNAMPTLDVIPMDVHRKCLEAEIEKRILTEKTNRQILENYVPVRHGRWQGEGDGYADGYLVMDVWYCSECGYCIDDGTDDPSFLPKYCPNCGAKMEGGKDNENA